MNRLPGEATFRGAMALSLFRAPHPTQLRHVVILSILSMWIGLLPLAGHQDTTIELVNGELRGLPKEFQPASFDIEKKILTISGKTLHFPESLTNLFPDELSVDSPESGMPYDLKLTASWYHGPSLLPPYLSISITPMDRDYSSNILIDIESVSFLRAQVMLRVSDERTEIVPVLIEEPKAPERKDDDWLSIIGRWRTGATIIEITKDQIEVTESGKLLEYPKGKISPDKPGRMSLELPGGKREIFLYERKGDILELSFERAPGIGLALLGSAADKAYQRRAESTE